MDDDDEPKNKASLEDSRRGEGGTPTWVHREASNKGRCSRKNSQIGQRGKVYEY